MRGEDRTGNREAPALVGVRRVNRSIFTTAPVRELTAAPPEDLGLDSEERVPLAALVDEDFLLWLRRLGPASRRGAESFAYSPGLAAAIRRAIVGLERPTGHIFVQAHKMQ